MLNVILSYCYAECRYAECPYAECRYAECRYAECCGALIRGIAKNYLKTLFTLAINTVLA